LKTKLKAIWRRTEDPSWSSTLLDFSHLTNLNTLKAFDSSWLSGSVQLPIGISRMDMGLQSVSMSWLKAFTRCQLHTFANLTYLRIDEDSPSSDRDPDVIKWLSHSGASGRLIFPSLRTLYLVTSDTNGADFIRHAFFPKLEIADLFLRKSEDMTTPNDDTTPIPAIPLPFLVKLYIYLSYSWAYLAALNGLISHPTQVEHIRIGELYSVQDVTPEFVDSLRNTLSMLQPLELELRSDSSSSSRFLLGALGLGLLQKLNIKENGQEYKKGPFHEYNKNSTIKVPNLTYLSLKDITVKGCIRHLTNFSMRNLEHLEVDISVGSKESEDVFEFLTSGQEPSHGEDDNFISLDDLPGPLYTKSFGLHRKGTLVKFLYESLGLDSAGGVKFPKLTSSQFSLEFDDSMYARKDDLVLGLEHCLRRVLKSRSKCGATRLTLHGAIQVQDGVCRWNKDDPPFGCNFRLLRR